MKQVREYFAQQTEKLKHTVVFTNVVFSHFTSKDLLKINK